MDVPTHDESDKKPPPSSSPESSSSPPHHPFSIARFHSSQPRRGSGSSPTMPMSLTTSPTNLDSPPIISHSMNIHHQHHVSTNDNSDSPNFNHHDFNSPSTGRRLSSGLSCVVCGDTSSGKHYGILACNGCSGFFKRSVRRKLIYRCQAGTGSCIVDKAHRNQCQACRLKKCLNMGMNKDAVQNERQPRNTATLRPEALCEMDQERALREAAVAVGVFGPLLGPRVHGSGMGIAGGHHHIAGGNAFHPHHPHQQQPQLLSSSHESILTSGNDDDDDADSIDVTSDDNTHGNKLRDRSKSPSPPCIVSRHTLNNGNRGHEDHLSKHNENHNGGNNTNNGNNNRHIVHPTPNFTSCGQVSVNAVDLPSAIYNPAHETIYETSARLLFMAVKWAKNLPSFASLPFRDQVILLEESWADLFLLNAIQWCMPVDAVSLFCSGDHLSHLPNNKVSQVSGDLRTMNDALNRFRAICVDPAEFACLKAIALFRSDTRGLKDPLQVENLQDQAQVMLCQHSRGQHPSQPARFGRLLLMLPLLRSVPAQRVELLFFQRTIGNTPMEKVLCDMYKN